MTKKKDDRLKKVFQSDLIPLEVAESYKKRYDRLKKEVDEGNIELEKLVESTLTINPKFRLKESDINFIFLRVSPNF